MQMVKFPKGFSRARYWIYEHMSYESDDCLFWPFGRDRHGYGMVKSPKDAKILRAHRFMCELVHGKPPTPQHYAAHECGKGHLGCINPQHLSWKTASENQFDRRRHGTHGNGVGRRGKLTPIQWQEIREAKGVVTQTELARRYGVAEGTIRGIQAGRWGLRACA